MLELDLWRILGILFKRIEVGENQKLFSESYDCKNSVNIVAEILQEILRAFMQISEVLMQKCLAEPHSRTP